MDAARYWSAAGLAWLAALAWATLGRDEPAVHRTLLAVAITVTVIAYIDRRALARDLMLTLGVKAGRGLSCAGESRDLDARRAEEPRA